MPNAVDGMNSSPAACDRASRTLGFDSGFGTGGQLARFWRAWGGVFMFALALSVIAYGLALSSAIISIDEEIHLGLKGATLAWVAQDRWAMYLLNWLLLPNPVLPYLPLLVGLVANSAAATVLASLWCRGERAGYREYLASAFVVLTPVSLFVHQFDTSQYGFFIGVLISAVSVKLYVRGDKRSRFLGLLCLCFAISVYQAVALVALAAYLVWYLGNEIIGEGSKGRVIKLVIDGVLFGLWMLGAMLLHKGTALLARRLFTDGEGYSLVDGFYSGALPNHGSAWQTSMEKFYLGDMWAMGWQTSALMAIALFASCSAILASRRHKDSSAILGFATLIAILVSPFMLIIVTGFVWPTRTMLGLPIAIAGVVWIGLASPLRVLRYAVVLAALVCSWHYVESVNRLIYADKLSWEHDRELAVELKNRINLARGSEDTHFRVMMVGLYTPPPIPAMLHVETIGASIFGWGQGGSGRLGHMLNIVGMTGVSATGLKDDFHQGIQMGESMPVWPAPGSVVIDDDLIVVKFSEPTPWQIEKGK